MRRDVHFWTIHFANEHYSIILANLLKDSEMVYQWVRSAYQAARNVLAGQVWRGAGEKENEKYSQRSAF